jgi:hypothetical protein
MPAVPPCSPPDTVLGSGITDALGGFDIPINPPLALNDCIYAYDTCNDILGPVVCIRPPAPAPAMSPLGTIFALAVLGLVALVGMMRMRRTE